MTLIIHLVLGAFAVITVASLALARYQRSQTEAFAALFGAANAERIALRRQVEALKAERAAP